VQTAGPAVAGYVAQWAEELLGQGSADGRGAYAVLMSNLPRSVGQPSFDALLRALTGR